MSDQIWHVEVPGEIVEVLPGWELEAALEAARTLAVEEGGDAFLYAGVVRAGAELVARFDPDGNRVSL